MHIRLLLTISLTLASPLTQILAHPSFATHSKTSPLIATEVDKDCLNKHNYLSPDAATPRGKKIFIADVPTYFRLDAERPPTKVLLFLSDVYSPFNDSNQLVQDGFADAGFHVLGIDYFYGDSVSNYIGRPQEEILAWIEQGRRQADEALPRWLKGVKQIYGPNAKYSTVGYCFGAPYSMDLGATNEVVANAIAHPAFLTEDHFTQLTKPVFLSCAEYDRTFPPGNLTRAADILRETEKSYHIQIFSGTEHGFATRADPADSNAVWAKDESLRSIAEWFDRFSK
ncbi:alpha/beta-hydrolase [Coprinopsis marcescibilis]|uniref:Alpha/beta-hydrolase n=1 Tax=Coprinopsis marcescibilis TaxID=230819 RepID=A0A5C3KFJ9_COPMA|nr:alpha/beta-hydrolase [Coprinopsis marcescibilis]